MVKDDSPMFQWRKGREKARTLRAMKTQKAREEGRAEALKLSRKKGRQ
jgi:hypothetical protein